MEKNLPATQETQVQSLGWEDPLKGKGDGYPFQYSSLENTMNRGAWWATVHAVAKSWTQTKHIRILKGRVPGRAFPGGPVVGNSPSNAGEAGSIPGLGTKISRAK